MARATSVSRGDAEMSFEYLELQKALQVELDEQAIEASTSLLQSFSPSFGADSGAYSSEDEFIQHDSQEYKTRVRLSAQPHLLRGVVTYGDFTATLDTVRIENDGTEAPFCSHAGLPIDRLYTEGLSGRIDEFRYGSPAGLFDGLGFVQMGDGTQTYPKAAQADEDARGLLDYISTTPIRGPDNAYGLHPFQYAGARVADAKMKGVAAGTNLDDSAKTLALKKNFPKKIFG